MIPPAKLLHFFIALTVTLLALHAEAQQLSTQNKKAEKCFVSAVDYYQRGDNDRALIEAEKAVTADPLFTEAYILQGDIKADLHLYDEAIGFYERAIGTGQSFSPNLYYILANIQLSTGRYQDAENNYMRFLEAKNLPPAKVERARSGLERCDFAIRSIKHPVPFHPINLGDSINTQFDEYINAITADGMNLYFTRKQAKDAQTYDQAQPWEEDFYRSKRFSDDTIKGITEWYRARNMGAPINSHGNEGALCISPDGHYLFFAACNREDGYGSCDLYWAKRLGDRWTEPENMGPVVNSPTWDSQPSFSSDGKTLYFASKRAGGKGSSDIWRTALQPDGSWTVPENLGDLVNSRVEEMAPFLHPDDRTIYFSSKGHPGMGGFDLFFSRKDLHGNWQTPVNIGYPINTFADEITLVVNAKGNLAFISSNIPGGKGKQDIYCFPLYKEAQPLPTTYFKGVVFDAETKVRLDARFELTDLATSAVIAESTSDRLTGEFLLALPTERNYALSISREGYLFYSDNFSLTGSNSSATPFIKDIPLKPVRIGETVILKNIFFDTDKFTLKGESEVELSRLTLLLKKNPKLKIEISGHTDNEGTPAYNLELSRNRAKTVYEYLLQRGIAPDRLSYAGYGLTRPVDVNTTDQGRANNRRTEFRVVGN